MNNKSIADPGDHYEVTVCVPLTTPNPICEMYNVTLSPKKTSEGLQKVSAGYSTKIRLLSNTLKP